MPVFEEVKIEWEGKTYAIPSSQVLRTIAQVEDIISLGELGERSTSRKLPFAKLSMALGVILRAAGCDVTADDVYNSLFKNGGKEMPRRALDAVVLLNMLMIPPEHLREKADAKKPVATAGGVEPSPGSTAS